MPARVFAQLRAHYWPDINDGDFTLEASKRTLTVFCLLAGISGLAITALNTRYLPNFAEQVALGFVLSIYCLCTPCFTNAARNFIATTQVFAIVAFLALAILGIMGHTLPSTATLAMIALNMTFTLIFGLRIGLLYAVGGISVFSWIYFTDLRALPPLAANDVTTIDWFNVYAAMSIVLLFTVLGSAVFRHQVVRATEGLKRSNAALEQERGSLERRVNERTCDMERALTAAENANKAKSQFLAIMSHELRTPLSAIIGYSELMLETAEVDGRRSDQNDHERVLRAARHLLALVNEVLDLSKVEAGKVHLRLAPVDMAALVAEAIEEVSVQAGARGNRVTSDLAADLGTAEADRQKLKQCLLNLLSNAVKFTTDGTVSVRARRNGDMIGFEVEDTGIGIGADDQSRLFEPFVQADGADARRFGGTGLGLAVTRRLARLMGGDVTMKSAPNVGSTFTMTLRAPVSDPDRPRLHQQDCETVL
jgi:signal transduction histidine kinase